MAGAASSLIQAFEERFQATPDVYRAPGRVNLIGEHTDYNLGYVLPVAIDLACYAASAPNRHGMLRVYSQNFERSREWPLDKIGELRAAGDWSDYIAGVARQIPLTHGRDLMIASTVPLGAGLSSSAALEVSTALALGWPGDLPSLDLVKLCHRAETDFVGLPCGMMDQYIAVYGRAHEALKIDCRSLESEPVQLPPGVALVAVNSMVRHELGESAYRQRVVECALAVDSIRRRCPEVASLRDAGVEHLALIGDPMVRSRARHVVTENQRVLEFIAASRGSEPGEMGRLLVASHRSLQHDYGVSCEELDFLVDAALAIPGVWGARMTGGGFGGCTVNLVDSQGAGRLAEELGDAYRRRFGVEAEFYQVQASDGAARIS